MSDDDNRPERDKTGRWKPGARSPNPSGRPRGSVTIAKSTNLRDQILAAAERQGLEVDPGSSDGITAYLKHLASTEPRSFAGLLGRVLPLMPAKITLPPIEKPADLVAAASAIAQAVSEGELAPQEASAISHVVDGVAKSLEIHVLAQRLDWLEERLANKGERR
jgi:hypothetical protein